MLSLLRRNYDKWKVFPPKDLIKTLSKIQITETSIFLVRIKDAIYMFNTDEHRDNVFLLRLHLKGIGSSICRTLKSLQAKPENLTFIRKERIADLFGV